MCRIFLVLTLALSSLVCFGQEKPLLKDSLTVNLEDLVVTATGSERELASLPLTTIVIKKKEIQEGNFTKLTDILTEQSSITTVSDFGGGNGIQLQGFDAEHTLIMIDGSPLVGRLAGTLNLDRLTAGNIKQIEIVKGASSSLYGSEALGGVVNIITHKPKEGLDANASYRYGSLDSHDGNVALNFKRKKIGITSFVNRYSSKGYDLVESDETATVTPYANYTLGSKIIYDVNKQTAITLNGRYFTQQQDAPSATIQDKSKAKDLNLTGEVSHKFSNRFTALVKGYFTNYKTEQGGQQHIINPFAANFYNQKLFIPEVKSEYKLTDNQLLIGGAGWRNESLDRSSFGGKPEFNSQFGYAQYDATFNNLNVVAGVRFDNHNEYASQLSPKLAARYDVSNGLAIKGSIGQGFKTPAFRELFFDFSNTTFGYSILGTTVAAKRINEFQTANEIAVQFVDTQNLNVELKPETSININLGLQFRPTNALETEVSFFRNNIKNLIDNNLLAIKTSGEFLFGYENVQKAFTQGLNINTSWQANDNFKMSGGYQLLYAKDKDLDNEHEDYYGLEDRSRHMTNLKLGYKIPAIDGNTNLRTVYRSKFGQTDTNGNDYLDKADEFVDDYLLVNWAFNKTFNRQLGVGLGIDNLFDYTDKENLSNLPGRLSYLKLNFNLK